MLTKRQLAERWGVCYRTLNRWLNRNDKIPRHINPNNGRTFFIEEEIERWERITGLGKND